MNTVYRGDFNTSLLGSFYSKDKTIFRVFAPESSEISLVIYNKRYKMHRKGHCFEIALGGDLQFTRYCYENNDGVKFKDPFSYLAEGPFSIVMDTNRFKYETFVPEKVEDPIIYELSVRDFSSDFSYTGKYKKKFLSLTEAGLKVNNLSAGLDYIKSLGVTHIQLMPILDFDNDGSDYNWGYNPLAFNYLKADYIYDTNNPYAFISEFRKTVNVLHQNNLRVTMDVVFNHVYDKDSYELEKMAPGHALRKKEDGSYAAGSLCGNEIRSEDEFTRAYLIEMTKRYVQLFDIDGIRIDLMGILDYQTVNELSRELRKIKEDFIVYGEGWNMGDILPEEARATIRNAYKMSDIAMFNDFYRDTIAKYVCGNDSINDDVKLSLLGTSNNLTRFQTINYVECHDGNTFYDRLMRYKGSDLIQDNIARCKLALGIVLMSRGIPFIHAGQEFLRTKNMIENSYNSGDDINKIDWLRRSKYNDVVEYVKGLIRIRRDVEEILADDVYRSFKYYDRCLIYQMNKVIIIINPSENNYSYVDGGRYEVLYDENGKSLPISKIVNVKPYSLVIAKNIVV